MNPGMSTRCASGSEFSGSTIIAAISAARPKITLNQKIPRQASGLGRGAIPLAAAGGAPPIEVQTPMIAPPITGPRARPRPVTAAHTPRAQLRVRSSGYRWRSIDRVPGSLAAAPIPITARPAISSAMFVASADMTDPAQKIPAPISMTRLRPNSSDTWPNASIRLANVSAYALITHCRSETLAFRSICTLPSPTATTVLSRNVRNKIVHSTASARSRPPRRATGTSGTSPAGTPTERTTG